MEKQNAHRLIILATAWAAVILVSILPVPLATYTGWGVPDRYIGFRFIDSKTNTVKLSDFSEAALFPMGHPMPEEGLLELPHEAVATLEQWSPLYRAFSYTFDYWDSYSNIDKYQAQAPPSIWLVHYLCKWNGLLKVVPIIALMALAGAVIGIPLYGGIYIVKNRKKSVVTKSCGGPNQL